MPGLSAEAENSYLRAEIAELRQRLAEAEAELEALATLGARLDLAGAALRDYEALLNTPPPAPLHRRALRRLRKWLDRG